MELIAFVLELLCYSYFNGLFFISPLYLEYLYLLSYCYLRFSFDNIKEIKNLIIFQLRGNIMNLINLKHNILITFLIIFFYNFNKLIIIENQFINSFQFIFN